MQYGFGSSRPRLRYTENQFEMKKIQLYLLFLLSIKSTLSASTHKFEERSKDLRRHFSQPLRIANVAIISENETLVVTVSSSDPKSDDNGSTNHFESPNDSKSDNSYPNNSPFVRETSTVDTPVNAPLVQNNTNLGTVGKKCNSTVKCLGKNVECVVGVCACIAGYEDHQNPNMCLEYGRFVRLRDSCNETHRCMGQFTKCNRGTCTCVDGYYTSDLLDFCIERTANHVDVPKTDPTMIGVIIGLALMSVTICVVMRLFAKARFRENRTIFNTANPRLMNVTMKKGSKHGVRRGRRGSQISVQSGECEEGSQRNNRYADNGPPAGPNKDSPSELVSTTTA